MNIGDTTTLEMLEEVIMPLPGDRRLVYQAMHSPGFIGDPRRVIVDEEVLLGLIAKAEGLDTCVTCAGCGEATEEDLDGRTTHHGTCHRCGGTGYARGD